MNDVSSIRNKQALIDIFGRWPSFHDAEVLSIVLDHGGEEGPSLTATIHLWQMTRQPVSWWRWAASARESTMPIIYKINLDGVDWEAMKRTLSQDQFDNGRSPHQLEQSFANSHCTCIAYDDSHIVGTARALSDGVCNAYLVDVWTLTPFRRQGIARTMIGVLLERLRGQHVYLFTDDVVEFYKKVGFVERPVGMERVVGQWLVNNP